MSATRRCAFALVSVAAAVETAGGVVQDVRLALGGVAHRPTGKRVRDLPITRDKLL